MGGRGRSQAASQYPWIDRHGPDYYLAVKVFAAQLTVCNLEPPESSSLLVARQVQRLVRAPPSKDLVAMNP